jgi:two-component system sensor histidine kinase/response regulator
MSDKLKNEDLKILIVDDIPQNIQVLGSILSKSGYNLAVAQNGLQAIESANHFRPDLILMDVTMPEMDGLQATKILKANDELKNIPVIFLTARDSGEDLIEGFKAGGVDYVTKPFNPVELLQRVETHIELKKSRDMIINQKLELEDLNKSKDKFFSIISHDLKGPFTGSIGLSELILERPDDFEKSEIINILQKIFNAQKLQLALIENLLDWSRIQTGRIEYLPLVLNLKSMAENIIRILGQNASNKSIELINSITDETTVVGDDFMITTILRNLISNAIKFTPINGKIEVYTVVNKNKLSICVKDSGVGMSEQDVNKLFKIENHYTTLGTTKEKGTGLGLILCKEFAEANKGDLTVTSEKGVGSIFSIVLNM